MRGVKLSQEVTQKAQHLLAQGNSQTETAKSLGVCRRKINEIAGQYRAEIEQLTLDYISKSIPLLQANHINTMTLASTLLTEATKKNPDTTITKNLEKLGLDPATILNLSDKKEYRALLTAGIIPSQTASVVLNQIVNADSVQLNTKLIQLLDSQSDELFDNDVIEVDNSPESHD